MSDLAPTSRGSRGGWAGRRRLRCSHRARRHGLDRSRPPGTRELHLDLLSGTVFVGAVTGAVLGVVLAIAVSLGERGRTVGALSERSIKRWGALAGLVALGVQSTATYRFIPRDRSDWYMILVCGPIMGASVASAYLALARRPRAAVESN